MGFLFWGEKNQFKKKFNQIKLKDLQKELTEKEVEQDVLTNEIQRWSSEYDGWFRKGSDPNATDTDLQICASRMEICESNKSRIESELQETVNEVSIIQAAIGNHMLKKLQSSNASRRKVAKIYDKNLTKKKINVLYSVVGLNHAARKIYKSKIENFLVTLIDADIRKIIELGKKKTYKKKKYILGIDIKPEYPKKPKDSNQRMTVAVVNAPLVKKIIFEIIYSSLFSNSIVNYNVQI